MKRIKTDEPIENNRSHLTKEIALGILKTGAVIGIAIMAPGLLKVVDEYTRKKEWQKYYPSSVNRVVNRLKRQGYVKIYYKDAKPIVKITHLGKTQILQYDLDHLEIAKPKIWDGRWRLVIFDIEERDRQIRNTIRAKLKELGFFHFQKSVFIYPYPCEKEIQYLREVLTVPHSLKLIRADRVENDDELRRHFHLTIKTAVSFDKL